MVELVTIQPENGAGDVVAALEQALTRARRGDVSSVAVAMVGRDGLGHFIWSSAPMSLAMLGAIRRLEYAFNDGLEPPELSPLPDPAA